MLSAPLLTSLVAATISIATAVPRNGRVQRAAIAGLGTKRRMLHDPGSSSPLIFQERRHRSVLRMPTTVSREVMAGSLFEGFAGGLLSKPPFMSNGRVTQLIKLAKQSDRGRISQRNEEMKRLVDELRASMQPIGEEKLKKLVNGSWVEMWTTEEAVLSLANKGFLGSTFDYAGGSINMYEDKFTNIVAFQNGNSIEADGVIKIDEENNRVSFRFNIAKIKIGGFTIPLPFSAGGFIDNVYADEKYRIGIDSRGDYRVYRRPNVPAN